MHQSYNEKVLNCSVGDDFDEADFNVPQSDHPDEVMLSHSLSSEHFRRRNSLPGKAGIIATRTTDSNGLQTPLSRTCYTTTDPVTSLKTPTHRAASSSALPSHRSDGPQKLGMGLKPQLISAPPQKAEPQMTEQQPPKAHLPQDPLPQGQSISSEAPSLDSSSTSEYNPPVGFFTARAAESLQTGLCIPLKAPPFNPHLESPSIRKTAGIDHTKTKPVGREAVGAPPQPPVARANSINPQSDKTRRVGMPMGAPSPLHNRGSYKPPQMKRAVENGGPRLALDDVTNVVSDAGGDVKRQKVALTAQSVNSGEGLLKA